MVFVPDGITRRIQYEHPGWVVWFGHSTGEYWALGPRHKWDGGGRQSGGARDGHRGRSGPSSETEAAVRACCGSSRNPIIVVCVGGGPDWPTDTGNPVSRC